MANNAEGQSGGNSAKSAQDVAREHMESQDVKVLNERAQQIGNGRR